MKFFLHFPPCGEMLLSFLFKSTFLSLAILPVSMPLGCALLVFISHKPVCLHTCSPKTYINVPQQMGDCCEEANIWLLLAGHMLYMYTCWQKTVINFMGIICLTVFFCCCCFLANSKEISWNIWSQDYFLYGVAHPGSLYSKSFL